MKRVNLKTFLLITALSTMFMSCSKTSPTEDVMGIIEATEDKLHNAETLDRVSDMQFTMLDDITECLDAKHNGYRYVDGDEEYDKIMKRLARYNIIYCRVLSKFNPELNTETGNQDKVVQVLALMKKMEHQALTAPNGFHPEGTKDIPVSNERKTESFIEEHGIFPTKGEIDSVNAKLPIMVSEGTLNTKVEYNEITKVQTFYYRFTQEVDESMVSNEVISQLKTQMVSVMRNDQNNVRRLNAGMTFLYIYYSVDGRRLYDIKIDSKDIN